MPENIEWKARLTNWDAALSAAQRLATAGPEVQTQRDTYFRVPQGRLKLREIRLADRVLAELIYYERADAASSKSSHYQRLPVPAAAEWLTLLSAALGAWAVVDKIRTIYWHRHVRLHLDRVAGQGDFLEFEAVLDESTDRAESQALVERLIGEFDLAEDAGLAGSYSDFTNVESSVHKPH